MQRRLPTSGLVWGLLTALLIVLTPSIVTAGEADGRLDIYWVDVEGGAATLIVTPSGESILVDAGLPGDRDPVRIHKLATGLAGLERIDHMVVTHFDLDHYGGVADLSRLMPVVRIYDPGYPGSHPFDDRVPDLTDHRRVADDRRTLIRPGYRWTLEQPVGVELDLRCLVAQQQFVTPRPGQLSGSDCLQHTPHAVDRSENRNSTVLILSFGPFRFFDGADLTWNLERQLVCPVNLVGKIDLFQIDHHGLDYSNHPVMIRNLEPRVAVVNNSATKGNGPNSFRALKTTPSIKAIYQVHRNLRPGEEEINTVPKHIANEESACKGEHIKVSVAADGKSYTVTVPSTGHRRTYETQ